MVHIVCVCVCFFFVAFFKEETGLTKRIHKASSNTRFSLTYKIDKYKSRTNTMKTDQLTYYDRRSPSPPPKQTNINNNKRGWWFDNQVYLCILWTTSKLICLRKRGGPLARYLVYSIHQYVIYDPFWENVP